MNVLIVISVVAVLTILWTQRRKTQAIKGLKTGKAQKKPGLQNPALLSLVQGQWIEQAIDYFKKSGKEKLYFYTNSGIGLAGSEDLRSVYFKLKGKTELSLKADWVELLQKNPVNFRLPGYEKETGRYYYGFKNLRWLKTPIPLTSLKHYKSGKSLRTDIPGACLIVDPNAD